MVASLKSGLYMGIPNFRQCPFVTQTLRVTVMEFISLTLDEF